jgi:RNA polymerase sigma factor (sigma-70 family)
VIEAEALAELVTKLPASRDVIITEHMPLCSQIGRWYARKNRRQPDDLISAAYLGLVQAVQWSCEGRLKDHNITPYIVVTVHRFCRDAIEADHTVIIERRARKEYREKKGEGLSAQLTDQHVIEAPVDRRMIYAELMDTFCVRYQAVIELRLAGYTQCEIAEKLNVSQPMVHKYIKEIKEKLSLMSNNALTLRNLI